jgi:cytochrome d ubiquinol oxidase subunit II
MTWDLNFIWFVLIGILLAGYAILDGFDLGVGALHLLTKTDKERRIMINSIGPVWDGNEVWLVTCGGAIFAAFPDVYATLCSGFYMAIFILLFSLLFRAIAIEFRSKEPMGWWRTCWDVSFSLSSIFTSFLFGVVLGNLVWGIPLNENGEFAGSLMSLLHPYAIIMGITTVALFMMHGSIYVVMKTEGTMHDKIRGWVNNCIIFFIICYAITTMVTLVYLPHMAERMRDFPVFFVVPLLNMLAIANIPREIHHGRDFQAFLSSCAAILALVFLFGLGVYPNMVPSNPHPEYSLTIYSAASSPKTLGIMFIIAMIGIPFVLAYTISIYWIFRGKVRLEETSY